MTNRAWFLLGILVVLMGGCVAVHAQAPLYNVQHNGVPTFSANALQHADQSTVWNFCDTPAQCQSVTPPPAHDPNAMQSAVATFLLHTTPCTQQLVGIENMGNLMIGGPSGTILPFPYRTTVVNVSIPAGQIYLGPIMSLPMNPGTLPHYLKGDLWGGSGSCYRASPTGVTIHIETVAVGTSRTPVGKCSGDFAFGSPWLAYQSIADDYDAPGQPPHNLNMTECSIFYPHSGATAGQYRVKMKAINGLAISTDLNWR